MSGVELWTTVRIAEHLGHTSTASTRRWLAQHGITARSRDVASGAKLYAADEVLAVVKRKPGRPRTGSAPDGDERDNPPS